MRLAAAVPMSQVCVTINGRMHPLDRTELSYADIVELAHWRPAGEKPVSPRVLEVLHTVTWFARSRPDGSSACGTLIPGKTIQLENGMIISAVVTGGA